MRKRVRIFLLIGQGLCILSTSGFILLFVGQTGLWNLANIDVTSNTFWIVVIGFLELPFAIIGLLQAFKPANKFMIWPCYFSLVYGGFLIYQTIVSMQVALFFLIVMFPNLLLNLGTMAMLVLAIVKGVQEKKALQGVPANL